MGTRRLEEWTAAGNRVVAEDVPLRDLRALATGAALLPRVSEVIR